MNLMSAMLNNTENLTENTAHTPDHATKYEEKDYDTYVLSVAITTLSPTEWSIINFRYLQGMTQDMVADLMKTNQKWVSRHEVTALEKLRVTLCNNM